MGAQLGDKTPGPCPSRSRKARKIVVWPVALQRSLYGPGDTKSPNSMRIWDPFQLGPAKWTHFPEQVASG